MTEWRCSVVPGYLLFAWDIGGSQTGKVGTYHANENVEDDVTLFVYVLYLTGESFGYV